MRLCIGDFRNVANYTGPPTRKIEKPVRWAFYEGGDNTLIVEVNKSFCVESSKAVRNHFRVTLCTDRKLKL